MCVLWVEFFSTDTASTIRSTICAFTAIWPVAPACVPAGAAAAPLMSRLVTPWFRKLLRTAVAAVSSSPGSALFATASKSRTMPEATLCACCLETHGLETSGSETHGFTLSAARR